MIPPPPLIAFYVLISLFHFSQYIRVNELYIQKKSSEYRRFLQPAVSLDRDHLIPPFRHSQLHYSKLGLKPTYSILHILS